MPVELSAARKALEGVPAEPGAPKPDPIVKGSNILRTFGGLKAVDVEHIEIQRGVITALIGPNGAGKTTLFNLLTGFDEPDEGDWSFNGHTLGKVPAYKVARLGHGAYVPADQGALQAQGHREHAPGRDGSARREVLVGALQVTVELTGGRDHGSCGRAARAVQARRQA